MEDEVKKASKPGIVMIDDTYGFLVDSDCYPFGKVKDGSIQNTLYPTNIESLFNLYSKRRIAELAADKQLSINQLLDIVNEVKQIIKEIKSKLEV